MSTISDTDWQAEAVRLRIEEKMPTLEIAERVGRSPSRVRRVIAQASTERHVNGTGPMAEVERVGELNGHAEQTPAQGNPDEVPPAFTVDEPPSIVWGGIDVNMQEFAEFIGRGPNGRIVAQKVALPAFTDGEFVHALPGDTVIRVAENAFEVIRPDGEEPEIVLMQGDIEAALAGPEDPLHAFKREAGESVGDMPPSDPPADPEPVEVRYAGTRQTCLDFGPNADLPTGGTLTIKSEKLASGHFGLGDVITGTFTARVTGFGAKESFDKASEEYRAKTVPYVATITEIAFEAVDGD